jgi:hypothetical protein
MMENDAPEAQPRRPQAANDNNGASAAPIDARILTIAPALDRQIAREQLKTMGPAWRFAAVASMALCIGLAGSLVPALSAPALALHLVQGRRRASLPPKSHDDGSNQGRRGKGKPWRPGMARPVSP